jgi:hypothetical protein
LQGGYFVLYHGYLKSFYRKRPKIILPKSVAKLKELEEAQKEEEEALIEDQVSAPLILSSFITSTVKIFSFLDQETMNDIADNAEIVELGKDAVLNTSINGDFYMMISGKLKYLDQDGNELIITDSSAISSLLQVLAKITELSNNENLSFEYTVVEQTKVIRVKQEALLKIKTKAIHVIRIIITRFKRVTISICRKYLVIFLPELNRLANKSISNLSIDVKKTNIKLIIDDALGFSIKSSFKERDLKEGELVKNPFFVMQGKLSIDTVFVEEGFGNIYFQILFGSIPALAVKDSKIIELSPELINEVSSDYNSLLKVSRMLLETLPKEMILADSLLNWQHYDAGNHIPKSTKAKIKLILHGRIKSSKGKEYLQGDSISVQEAISPPEDTLNEELVVLRDTEIAALPHILFQFYAKRCPSVSYNFAQKLIKMQKTQTAVTTKFFKTVAILPTSHQHRHLAVLLAQRMHSSLSKSEECMLLDTSTILDILGKDAFTPIAKVMLGEFLSEREDSNRVLLYLAVDGPQNGWTRRSLKQADLILFVIDIADENSSRFIGEYEKLVQQLQLTTRCELVLVHDEAGRKASSVLNLLSLRPWIASHQHVYLSGQPKKVPSTLQLNRFTLREWDQFGWSKLWRGVKQNLNEREQLVPYKMEDKIEDADILRLSRKILGRRIGLVLTGGGARGCSQVGIIRALKEAGIDFDIVGGCSMGAFIAALYADQTYSWYVLPTLLRYFSERMSSWWRQSLDLTIPIVAWFTGHHFNRTLWKFFGETCIDDLWIDYFCVSTDLSRLNLRIHRRGLDSDDYLWRLVRGSMTLCGVVPPLCDRHGNILVDGGYLNNRPADICLGIKRFEF